MKYLLIIVGLGLIGTGCTPAMQQASNQAPGFYLDVGHGGTLTMDGPVKLQSVQPVAMQEHPLYGLLKVVGAPLISGAVDGYRISKQSDMVNNVGTGNAAVVNAVKQ